MEARSAALSAKQIVTAVKNAPCGQKPTTDDLHLLRRLSRTCTALRVTALREWVSNLEDTRELPNAA
jgi:hypothetical protein